MAWTPKAELVFFCREQSRTIQEIVTELQSRDKGASETWIAGLIADCVKVGLLRRTATAQGEVYQANDLGRDEMARYQAAHSPYPC